MKFMRDQRWQINEKCSEVLQSLVDLDPTFTGLSRKLRKIEGVWLLVSAHFAHPASFPDPFAFSC